MPSANAELIESYEQSPSSIAAALEGLTEAQLLHRPGNDEWSIHEIIIHLADSEAVGYWRIRKTLAEAEPELAVYAEAVWGEKLQYRLQDRALALKLFSAQRSASAALLRLIPLEAWERVGNHTENGHMTVYDLFITYLEHGKAHLQQIKHIKQTIAHLKFS
ncbi:MAG: hypothetical protein NVSMB44_05530 [Ktedonobacteraceae bacterium]